MKDMTTGSPMRLVLSFMLPLLLGMVFQQFYNMVDTVVVGKFLGVKALAGVGSTGSINFLVLGLCNGICAGFAIPVAQKFGQRDFDGLRKFVGNMIWLSVFFAAAITLVTTVLCRQFLVWMNTPEDTFSYAYDYIFLIFLGIPATMLYNLLSGIIRSLGDSRTPLYFLVFSSLLNVVLDVVFILSFHMGVAGAGWATLLSQLISGLLCLGYMAKYFPILRLKREDLKLDWSYSSRLLMMGLPMGMQYSITAMGSILLQTAVNTLGASAMAAMTAGSKVSNFAVCPFDAIGSTAATFAGQNIGASEAGAGASGRPGGFHHWYCVLHCDFWGADTVRREPDHPVPGQRGGHCGCGVHYPAQPSVSDYQCSVLHPAAVCDLLRFTIQGLGFSNLAVGAGVFEMVARGVFGLCLVPFFGFAAVCFANPAAWVMADVFLSRLTTLA